MKKILIFLLSYVIGLAILLVGGNSIILYLIILASYVIFAEIFEPISYKRITTEPLILALSSSVLISFFEGKAFEDYGSFLVAIGYVIGISAIFKEKKGEKEPEYVFFFKTIIFSCIAPIAIYFISKASFGSSYTSTVIFILAYLMMITSYSKKILYSEKLSVLRTIMFTAGQGVVLVYLLKYINISSFDKTVFAIDILLIPIATYYIAGKIQRTQKKK